jgi:hypothetical protein
MPLFWEMVVLGREVARHASSEFTPSASTPPWTRASASGPDAGTRDASADATTSPTWAAAAAARARARSWSAPGAGQAAGHVAGQARGGARAWQEGGRPSRRR